MMVFTKLLKKHNQLQPRFKPKKSHSVAVQAPAQIQVSVPAKVSDPHQKSQRSSHQPRLKQIIALPAAKVSTGSQHVYQTSTSKPSTSNESARSGVHSFSTKTTQTKQASNSGGMASMILPSDFEHLYHAPSNANDTSEAVKRVAEERP